jgi:antitoxin component of MazEF toxin-antitoxin module
LRIPAEVAVRYGLSPGARVRIDEENNELHLHRPVTQLAKVYIEPTSQCNLARRIVSATPGESSQQS